MHRLRAVFVALMLAITVPAALAVTPDEVLDDPALEARARQISSGLRCLVCQNQSIDDSDAPLAHDLRVLVRERLVAGDTDEEVIAFIVDRYGEYVLLSPKLSRHTFLLWLAPAGFLLAGGLLALLLFRRNAARSGSPAPLSDEEKARIAALLDEHDRQGGGSGAV
ncbi:MAG: cytochrome c-type biogenesis protein CcmH [Rhodobiaceae bacterium]|nr:cytochrome c-type biogenesis protein CcmH [Rhodobiaceae bacterium]MCC0012883.1 cytochrome c-type biogenesis protein CcmH [Rhodobiaceae bacterium]MCC0019143.1 cytochrome c-type biogenesis protein CcmH [Rhodobiaceae bacterium]MCC0051063.1 cytochrome c-type biogenesis protein CcmH [Rhodobiaceae bacterium]MCC0060090.1 cytochrome c-type biogenesis protein CcmH [Rhodobiaceae bacterium]